MSSHSLLTDSSSGAISSGPREGLNISQSYWVQEEVPVAGMSYGSASTIDVLTDDILINIFHFCRKRAFPYSYLSWGYKWDWDSLVHACRRWRQIVFASPRHLYIQLQCTPGTPVRSHLSCWPPLPIIIDYGNKRLTPNDEDNVIAALEHPDRVSSIRLSIKRSQLEKIATAMQEPFPALRHLTLISDRDTQVLPDGFLGGSAPCLQRLCLGCIPFPALPTLLSSASHLVELELYDIPKTGYIPPEAMVGGLAALTRLHTLFITFRSMTSRRPGPLPATRTVLPALINFEFEGVSTYLEDLVTRVDCPRIKWFKIFYLKPRVGFRGVRLLEFINRLETPRLREFGCRDHVVLCISFLGKEWRVSHVVQLLDQFSAPLSNVRHLSIGYYRPAPEISQ
ncbi:hypothetical protein EDB89DRAFT_440214 [Lactarius sanguifluus]|nr:hypothetical protein EDB89DRAFT_440214 [Lactarius sanguifluus]